MEEVRSKPTVSLSDGESVVVITSFNQLCHESKLRIEKVLIENGLIRSLEVGSFDNLQIPKFVSKEDETTDLSSVIGKIIEDDRKKSTKANTLRNYPDRIDFEEVNIRVLALADFIELNYEELVTILTQYETHEVAKDEIERTLDLLRSLPENEAYFRRKTGAVGSFLPINQPLYAFACFSIVPALMASQVLVRPPVAARDIFASIKGALNMKERFPNIEVSEQSRSDFIERCKSEDVEAIIFTGKMENAYRVRKSFSEDVLFIVNGAGHNPIVVSSDADLDLAVNSALRVQLYNQGQDCANPSAILVHSEVAESFLQRLRQALRNVVVGKYEDANVRVGPISNPKDIGRIVGLLNRNRPFLDPETPGITHAKTGIVEPTIINRPLIKGGNYSEQLAPIFFLHEYETDEALSGYFENDAYSQNAMYISLFGSSQYVDNLTNFQFSDGRRLHDEDQIIRNRDIHAKGVERGTQPYGGYGRRASCLIINGRFIPKPTLPQRDMFEQLVEPVFSAQEKQANNAQQQVTAETRMAAERTLVLTAKNPTKSKKTIAILEEKNEEYVAKIEDQSRLERIRELRQLLVNSNLETDEIMDHVHKISRNTQGVPAKTIFTDLYNLLIGQDYGPRISTLISKMDREKRLKLLDI